PEIIELARLIGRTPSAVAMKACNFASLDPVQRARNISALGNVSRADRSLWESFAKNSEAVANEAEVAYAKLDDTKSSPTESEIERPEGPTEIERRVRVRRVQGFFRTTVLTSYEYRCAISGIAIPELLVASHIIPWSENSERRADPRNGIALNAFYDRAFDRGLITFDTSFRLVLSSRLRVADAPDMLRQALLDIEGQSLQLPSRFAPDPEAMAFHREHIFQRSAT
ncbi:MAG: HNH endonuclease, partial [Gammaproteobacteria bacterium]|nr:HNH endonuclease [Gammaproteobacteria bacterium]